MIDKDKKQEYEILSVASHIGRLLLSNGSETYRIEKYVCDVGEHFNFKAECFATLTCIVISFKNPDGEIISVVERVKTRGTNLDKVQKLGTIVKNLENLSLEEIKKELVKIEEEASYSLKMKLFGSAVGAGFFSVLFNGSANEFIASLIGGLLVGLISELSNKIKLGMLFNNVVSGMMCSLIAFIFLKIGFIQDIRVTIISTLMLMVPGVAFINSIRDLFSGDLVSGISRVFEVIVIGSFLALGSGVIIKLLG